MLGHEHLAWRLAVLGIALVIDVALGEPPFAVHPTVWIGKAISFLNSQVKRAKAPFEKFEGALLGLTIIGTFTITIYFILNVLSALGPSALYVIASGLLLKTTFAIRSMEEFTRPIALAAKAGDYGECRKLLRHIVRRDPDKLDDQQVLSAAVETIAEGTVDGIISPLFYYALFGVPGAIAFRTINTLDSMLGYKDAEHVNIGWFSAKVDTVANFLPARITGVLTIMTATLVGQDWKNASRILKRDRSNPESFNSGWPMAATAGTLNVKLEKPGHYQLGDPTRPITPNEIILTLRIMKFNTLVFIILVNIPLMIILSIMEWHLV